MSTIVQPTIFREYIGKSSVLNDFPDIINPKLKEFHFILAFATDDYDETTGRATGNFTPGWDLQIFNAETIKRLKLKYEFEPVDVKVVIGIGGRGKEYPFNPSEKEIWLENAKTSLVRIIKDFNNIYGCNLIDGIDVNYEIIQSSAGDFAESIGELIKSLKHEGLVKVASIAPSLAVRAQYNILYKIYGGFIDLVDYQFYDQKFSKKGEFEKYYRDLLRDFPNVKLLAGFSTDPSDAGKISLETFIEGSKDLLGNKLLPGIFVWDADDSITQGFQAEKLLQQLLVDFYHKRV